MACKFQYKGQWYSEDQLRQVFENDTLPPVASAGTLRKVKEFLSRIGVDIKDLADIEINGSRVGINGVAIPLRGLIGIAQGKEDIALTEEAAHMAVELIQQKFPSLFKEMMNSIGNYSSFNSILTEYRDIPAYQVDGRPNIPKIKKEAIGKVLAATIIFKNEEMVEKPELLAKSQNWWVRIVEFLKSLFNKAAMNPFEVAAAEVLDGSSLGDISDIRQTDGSFYQVGADFLGELDKRNLYTAKTPDGYEVNGEKVRNTIDKKIKDFFRKKLGPKADRAFNEAKEKEEEKVNQDIQDILTRYIDDTGSLRAAPLPMTAMSAINPLNNTFYNTLENNIKERLTSYPAGTKFYKNLNIYDEKTSTAGTVDLLVVGDKIDLFQFKVPDLPKGAKDIPLFRQEAYNIEVEALKNILITAYGVNKKDFDKTRALPIKATFDYVTKGVPASGLKVTKLNIGNVDAKLIVDDVLFPVPGLSEDTGNKRFNEFLTRLRGLIQKLQDERVAPEKRLEKNQRINQLVAAVRKLRVQGNADGVISSAKAIIKSQQERFIKLKDKIDKTDPNVASIEELNILASDILDEKDQVELYVDMYQIFKNIFTDPTDENKKYVEEARNLSDDARDILDRFWDLSRDFRTQKFAVRVGIKDEMDPEKQQNMYRRLIRSLSQSSTKAGSMLWALVKRINNGFQLQFQDRLTELQKVQEGVDKWMSGKSVDDLYKKIFQFDAKGRWQGRVIQKVAREFYVDLKEAQDKGDRKWVLDNIDIDAYEAWFKVEHAKMLENAKTARVHEDDAENKKRILANLTDFVQTFSTKSKRFTGTGNYKLRDFPVSDKWKSEAFKELEKPENAAVLSLYDYWVKRLAESVGNGMIQEHNGWSWFPNVRRNLLEKISTAKAGNKISSLFGNLRVEVEDVQFGKTDPLTGKPVDEVHANFVADLSQWAQDADGGYFKDFSEKSMDIFKVLALWDAQIIKYNLKVESEGLARMLVYTEQHKDALATQGRRLKVDANGDPIVISNEVNTKYIKDHIDAVYYGRATDNESDVTINIPYKAAVKKINSLFGKEVITEPAEEELTISGVKALETMNRFFVTKTLGLNFFTSVAQLFGGTINTLINQGRYFDKKDVLESELEFVSGRFWASDENKKMAGLLSHVHAYAEDRTGQQMRNLSVSAAVKYLSSDHLFILQRGSDSWVNGIIGMSMIKNTIVVNGKLVNAREFAKKELGHSNKYATNYADAKKLEAAIDARVEELKAGPTSLLKVAQIVDDKIVIPGIDRTSETMMDLRQSTLEVIKDALGNTGTEDLSLYKRSIMWKSFFMFKNWIPRMADVRFQSLKFAPGTDKYEWGRMRMLGSALKHNALGVTKSLLTSLGSNEQSIIDAAQKAYKEKQAHFASQREEFTLSEAEFIDSYIKGVRTQFKELVLAIGMIGLVIAARANAPDNDESAEIKGGYKWALRGLDKLQDELSFFYNPISFTSIVNGSVFPAVSLLVDVQKFFGATFMEMWYHITGDDEGVEKNKVAKHVFKIMPITKELLTYLAIFNDDMAKEYGIRLTSNNGSHK